MTTFYAFEYRYGSRTLYQRADGKTHYAGKLHAFATRAERDAWVAARKSDCIDDSGYRDGVTRAWAIRNGDIARSDADEYTKRECECGMVDHREAQS